MAWCRPGDKPFSEPMMVSLVPHICITWSQWVKHGITHRDAIANIRLCFTNYIFLSIQFGLDANGLSEEAICQFVRGIFSLNLPWRMTKDDGWDLIHHYIKQLRAPLKCNNATKSQEEHNLFRYRITILLWNMMFNFCDPENNTTVILRPLAKGETIH